MIAKVIWILLVFLSAAALAAEKEPPGAGGSGSGKIAIRTGHPRVWLDEAKTEWVKKKLAGKPLEEVRALCGDSVVGRSLAYVITGDDTTGLEAVDRVMKLSPPREGAIERMAVCYDWCYPLLSAEEKKAIATQLAQLCRGLMKQEKIWRSFHNGMYTQGWRVGVTALALYRDDPFGKEAFDFVMPEWEDALRTFEKVYADGAWGEGYNYNHHVANEALRFFEALRTATGVDRMAGTAHLVNNGLYMMYGAKPNGLVYPGDDDDFPYLNWFEHEALLIEAQEFAAGRHQYFANHCQVERFKFTEDLGWKDVLWNNPTVKERPLAELPLSRIFRDDGLVIMRGGWTWDEPGKRSGDAWLTFRCGPYLGDHAHYDNNSFEIYYKGELAIDSGRYDDDWGMEGDPQTILKSEFFNYYQRTIAHNTMLVYDPAEKFQMGVVNDGGQLEQLRIDGIRNVPEDYDQGTYPTDKGRGANDWARNAGRWDTGRITGYMGTKDFTYVCGDATKSYSPAKMKSFVRQFLFIQPNVVMVFDRVESTKPEFRKTWLLHSANEPKIAEDGRSFEVVNGDGRLVCAMALPEKRDVRKVGGPGNECLVGERHFKFGPQSEGAASELHYGEIPGAWRIEKSPAEPSAVDYFLNVMLLTDGGSTEYPFAVAKDADPGKVELTVMTEGGIAATIRFAKDGAPGGTLKLVKGADVRIAGAAWFSTGGKTVFDGPLPAEIILEEGRPK